MCCKQRTVLWCNFMLAMAACRDGGRRGRCTWTVAVLDLRRHARQRRVSGRDVRAPALLPAFLNAPRRACRQRRVHQARSSLSRSTMLSIRPCRYVYAGRFVTTRLTRTASGIRMHGPRNRSHAPADRLVRERNADTQSCRSGQGAAHKDSRKGNPSGKARNCTRRIRQVPGDMVRVRQRVSPSC